MEKSSFLKVLFLLTGLLIFQYSSLFPRQYHSSPDSDLKSESYTFRTADGSLNSDPPIITWIYPTKQYTEQKSLKVTITAKLKTSIGISSVSVYINDILYGSPDMSVSTNEVATFVATKTLTLEPGENNIYLLAKTSEGSTASEKRVINVQMASKNSDLAKSPPSIEWSNPSEKYSTIKTSTTKINATINSGSDLKSVELFLNGVSLGATEAKESPDDTAIYIVEETINFRQTDNNIYIIATNNAGVTTSDKRFILVPAPSLSSVSELKSLSRTPTIKWLAPAGFNSTTRSNKTTISATVKSALGITSVSLYLNDVLYGAPDMTISATEVGAFIASKSLTLDPGENKIYLVATNSEGSATSEMRFITIPLPQKTDETAEITPSVPPAIIWSVPVEKSISLKSASTVVKLIIKSNSDLKSVVLFLNGISQGETEVRPLENEIGSFLIEKAIDFKQIENSVFFEAENKGGITTSLSRIFICPPSSLLANQQSSKSQPATNEKVQEKKPSGYQQTQSNQAIDKQTVSENKPAFNEPVKGNTETMVQKNETETVQRAVATESAKPIITWSSPSGTHTTLETFSATVKAIIKSDEGLKSVLLYVNGISKGEAEIKTLQEQGNYLIEKAINFGPGENNIYIVATSNAGSTKSDLRYFSNPSALPPVINWTNPTSANSVVNIESFKISACIKSLTELRSVRLIVNGNIQSEDNVFQPSSDGDCNYNWQSSVILRDGDNSIYIIATNAAGSIPSEKRIVKYSQAISEKRLALVFGNSEYKNKAPLKNPVNDANLIEGTLRQLGFDVIKRLNVGKSEMEASIREFNEKLPDYNVALFYYAGHGNQVEGKNFLIPTDAVLEKPGDCKYEAIDVNWIVEEFEKYQDNTNIVILDACRSNPFASWTRGSEAGFRAISFTSGTIVAYATSEGTTAADGKGTNGLYTEELVKQMVIPQPISSVFNNTRIQVRKLSNNTQVPSETNKLNGEFFFKK
jgi:hypothetical protein